MDAITREETRAYVLRMGEHPKDAERVVERLMFDMEEVLVQTPSRNFTNPPNAATRTDMDTEKLKDQHEADIDTMRDVYMTKAQREAYERLLAELEAARRNETRYLWLRDNRGCSYGMSPDTPAEHGIYWSWRQAIPAEAGWSLERAIDADIEATPGDEP